jgi:hypothetical protein
VLEADLRAHLRSHVGGEGGWTICMHVEGLEATTASLVTTLPVDEAPLARFLLGSPCRSVYVPLLVGQPFAAPDAGLADALAGVGRPALDDLEAQLDAAVAGGVGPGWNDEAWRTVAAAVRSPS